MGYTTGALKVAVRMLLKGKGVVGALAIAGKWMVNTVVGKTLK